MHQSYRNHFLIAMPALQDTLFSRSVTYLCEHTEEGAMGVIINIPLSVKVKELLFNLDMTIHEPNDAHESCVFAGGPIQQDRGFVLHRTKDSWQSSIHPSPTLTITSSKDILQAIADGKGPKEYLIALGYAGWEAGQLEQEMSENTWLVSEAQEDMIFHKDSEQSWKQAAQLIGVDLNLLSGDVGHA